MKLVALVLALVAPAALAGCGDDAKKTDPKAEARSAVQTYLKALGSADAAAACRAFSGPSQKEIAKFGREQLKSAATCPDAMKKLLAGQPRGSLKKLAAAPITAVKTSGTTGTATVEGLEEPIRLVREGGAWRIRSEPTRKSDF